MFCSFIIDVFSYNSGKQAYVALTISANYISKSLSLEFTSDTFVLNSPILLTFALLLCPKLFIKNSGGEFFDCFYRTVQFACALLCGDAGGLAGINKAVRMVFEDKTAISALHLL